MMDRALTSPLAVELASPNWNAWPADRACTLEQCVALSLDRDPVLTREYSFTPAPGHEYPTRSEYDAAMRNFDALRSGQPAPEVLAEPPGTERVLWWDSATVDLQGVQRLRQLREAVAAAQLQAAAADASRIVLEAFAQWAAHRARWQVPEALSDLAGPKAVRLPLKPSQDAGGTAQTAALRQAAPTNAPAAYPHGKKLRRRDPLDPLIDLALASAGGLSERESAWAHLEAMARLEKPPVPLLGVNSGGIRYNDGGKPPPPFTKRAFMARLTRRAAKSR